MTDDATALGVAAARLLADSGRFPIRPGLTDAEIAAVEAEFGFTFADDHRAFLAAGMPWGRGWPDWREGDRGELRVRLALPVEGVLFDVVENGFWYDGWGRRPADDDAAASVARGGLVTAPRMIPLYSQSYLPAGRSNPGHPVLSIYQTYVTCSGATIVDYLGEEFGLGEPAKDPCRPTVAFWSRLV